MTFWLPDDGEFGQRLLLRAFWENVGEGDMVEIQDRIARSGENEFLHQFSKEMERAMEQCAQAGVDRAESGGILAPTFTTGTTQ